jgi:hypothetical protein
VYSIFSLLVFYLSKKFYKKYILRVCRKNIVSMSYLGVASPVIDNDISTTYKTFTRVYAPQSNMSLEELLRKKQPPLYKCIIPSNSNNY